MYAAGYFRKLICAAGVTDTKEQNEEEGEVMMRNEIRRYSQLWAGLF
jgi:hypothetical protein